METVREVMARALRGGTWPECDFEDRLPEILVRVIRDSGLVDEDVSDGVLGMLVEDILGWVQRAADGRPG